MRFTIMTIGIFAIVGAALLETVSAGYCKDNSLCLYVHRIGVQPSAKGIFGFIRYSKHSEANSSTCDHFTDAKPEDKCADQAKEDGEENPGENTDYLCGHNC